MSAAGWCHGRPLCLPCHANPRLSPKRSTKAFQKAHKRKCLRGDLQLYGARGARRRHLTRPGAPASNRVLYYSCLLRFPSSSSCCVTPPRRGEPVQPIHRGSAELLQRTKELPGCAAHMAIGAHSPWQGHCKGTPGEPGSTATTCILPRRPTRRSRPKSYESPTRPIGAPQS